MIYIDSKGKRTDITQLENFHLSNAHAKIQAMRNHLGGFKGAENDDIVRYVEIVRENLWNEIERRSNNKKL